MTQKIAVAVVHGMGKQGPDFADKIKHQIEERCWKVCGSDIVVEPVYWARPRLAVRMTGQHE